MFGSIANSLESKDLSDPFKVNIVLKYTSIKKQIYNSN